MTINTAILIHALRVTGTSYVVRVTANSVTEDLTFPPSGTLTVGRNYYMAGDMQADAAGDFNGVGDLMGIMRDTLNDHSELSGTKVYWNSSDWLLGMDFSQTTQILWSHANTTLDAELFGFSNTADSSTGTTVYSLDQAQGLWHPDCHMWNDRGDFQPIVGGQAQSISGKSRTSRIATPKKERDPSWRYLPNTLSLTEYASATNPYGTFEYVWTNALSKGWPFRIYPDDTTMSGTGENYSLYTMRDLSWRLEPEDDKLYLWRVTLPVRLEEE